MVSHILEAINTPPWFLTSGGLDGPIFKVTQEVATRRKSRKKQIVTSAVANTANLLVRRNEKTSLSILQDLLEKTNAEHEERIRKFEASITRLSPLEQEIAKQGSNVYTMHVLIPFYTEDYDQQRVDPCYRWLNEVSVEPHSECIIEQTFENSASIVHGKQVQCNICGELFDWNSKSNIDMVDDYGLWMDQFKTNDTAKLSYNWCRFNTSTNDLWNHCTNSDNHLTHVFCLRQFPAKTQVWPWELRAVDIAQEMLWTSFGEIRGIPKNIVSVKNPKKLHSCFLMIIAHAMGTRLSMFEKLRKRFNGIRVSVPSNWPSIAPKFRDMKKLKGAMNTVTKIVMDVAMQILKDLYESMVDFPMSTFIYSFKSNKALGFKARENSAWNSLSLFFAAGLMDDVYFPFVPNKIDRISTAQTYLESQVFQAWRETCPETPGVQTNVSEFL